MSKREQYSDYIDYLKRRCTNKFFNNGINEKTNGNNNNAVTEFKKVLNGNTFIDGNKCDVEALHQLKLLKENNNC